MQTLDGTTVFAATDLVGYLECEHLTALEEAALRGDVTRPVRDDPELAILQRRGLEHEDQYLGQLRASGLEVVDGRIIRDEGGDGIERLERIRRNASWTRELMEHGTQVIYQATFFDGRWLGYVDFLRRVDGESDLGPFHYEVVDTKLARRTKGSALLQMCVYSDLAAAVQGRMPDRMHVALGGSEGRTESHRLADYLAYYRSVKRRFLEATADGQLRYPLAVVPPPVNHCGVCRWEAHCAGLRLAADHLSQVAGLRRDQARRLEAAGLGTMAALAHAADPVVDGISVAALDALHAQARLQDRSRDRVVPLYELLAPRPGLGLSGLPAPSRGDLFFDMEGDPYAEVDGLEYLFGIWDPMVPDLDGGPTFRSWWAHSRAEEKAGFEAFVDFVMARWRADPQMHVYHYAAYERGRMGLLSTRHATREDEVDRMLRGGLFVDLYKAVRQGVRIGTASYSIKKLEPLYDLDRAAELKDAASSIVEYERYIESVSGGRPDHQILDGIEAYNREDCRSNALLRDWLEARRDELAASLGEPVPRPDDMSAELQREVTERDARIADLARRLFEGVPLLAERRVSDPELQGRWLLANLLEWHRREEKVDWWAFFERCTKSDEQLVEDEEAIGQLTWIGEVDRPKQSVRHRYRFDPEQPYRLKEGDAVADPATADSAGTIVGLDALNGTVDLQWGARHPRPHPTSIIPGAPIQATAQKAALERIGEWVAAHGMRGPGSYRAAREFLLRMPPDIGGERGAPLVDGEPIEGAARRLVLQLHESVLPVQGPPGAGKTYIGAEMILELIRAGRNVGITAFTHRALTNLLDAVLEHAERVGLAVRAIRKIENNETVQTTWRYDSADSNDEVMHRLHAGSVDVAAGTAWVWARGEFERQVDTLFVDEAGQMSLANVVAVSQAARNVVLLGDPQQLSQVKKGAHPEGVDVSSLEYVLEGAAVIDGRRGLFLPETHRLHPDVNAFTSEIFYEGRLRSAPETRQMRAETPGRLTGTGVRWLGVEHVGNRNSSIEEADLVADLYTELLAGRWRNERGEDAPLSPASVLVVAPYNAQVDLLTERLRPIATSTPYQPGEPRVGTVDKIQGQQAAVVIYSLATSSQDELPRTLEFLYSLNRLNVATSRGRCLAAIACSPNLLRVSVHTPFQMRLANALCRFVEMAEPVAPEQASATEKGPPTLPGRPPAPSLGLPGAVQPS